MKLSDLHGHPANPRRISDDKLKMLKKSLDEFGDLSGFVFNVRTKRLSGGHQRKKVMPDNAEVWMEERMSSPTRTGTVGHGYVIHDGEKYACRFVDWDELKEKAANIAANHHGGEDEPSALADFLLDLDAHNYDLELTGLTHEEIEDICAPYRTMPEEDEDAVPEPPKIAKTQRGELWLLGEHRLLIDDCTVKENVERLMQGEKADICFTSPPYNAGRFEVSGPFANQTSNPDKYLAGGDDLSQEEYRQFINGVISSWIDCCDSLMLNIGLLEGNKRAVVDVLKDNQNAFKEILFWVKSHSTPHIQPGIVTRRVEPIYCFGHLSSRQFKTAQFKGNFTDVIEGESASKNEFEKVHAATFPIYLPEAIVNAFTSNGSVVSDCFLGSGSTLIACEKTGRKCFGMEIEPLYGDVIIERWQKFTGKEATREDGVKFNELT